MEVLGLKLKGTEVNTQFLYRLKTDAQRKRAGDAPADSPEDAVAEAQQGSDEFVGCGDADEVWSTHEAGHHRLDLKQHGWRTDTSSFLFFKCFSEATPSFTPISLNSVCV